MNRERAEPRVRGLSGERARQWIEFHHRHAAPSEYSHDFVWDVTADAEGPFCTDVDGNVFLDFTCHIGAAPLGYNNPKILDRLAAFDLVDPMKIAGQDFYYASGASPDAAAFPGASHLMELLVDVSADYDMDTVFLCNSGGEAMENAMKIAYARAEVPKYGITCAGAFHGRTIATLSLTRSKDVFTRRYPELAGTRTVQFCEDRSCAVETCSCGFFADERSQLSRMLAPEGGHLDPEEVAYLAIEPIQGVGGYNFPSDAFMDEVARVCETYDITLIVDEIQTGVGRSGEMWASDHFAIEPDIIAAGKALRVGATISRADVFPAEKNRIGSTWGGGDILSTLQGVLTIEAIQDYDLMENARVRGEHAQERLRDESGDPIVDVRGLGLLLAVEFDTKARRDRVVREALERGLLLLGCGQKTVRMLPPLDVSAREIDLGVDLLLASVDATR